MRRIYGIGIDAMKFPAFVTLTLWHPKGTRIPAVGLTKLWAMRKYLFWQLREGKPYIEGRDYQYVQPYDKYGNVSDNNFIRRCDMSDDEFFKVQGVRWIRRPYKIGSWCGCIEPPNHVHIVMDCEYVPQYEIAELWHSITGDSMIVDIRAIVNRQRATYYITKYITKTKDWDYETIAKFCKNSSDKVHRICQSDDLEKEQKEKYSLCKCGKCELHPTYTSEYYEDLEIVDVDEYRKMMLNQRQLYSGSFKFLGVFQ